MRLYETIREMPQIPPALLWLIRKETEAVVVICVCRMGPDLRGLLQGWYPWPQPPRWCSDGGRIPKTTSWLFGGSSAKGGSGSRGTKNIPMTRWGNRAGIRRVTRAT